MHHIEIRESSRARHLSLKITSYGQIVVTVPRRMRNVCVSSFVQQHREWIDSRLDKLRQTRQVSAEADVMEPKQITLLATDESFIVELKSKCSQNNRICEYPGRLLVENSGTVVLADQLKHWMQKKSKSVLLPWLVQKSQETGLVYKKVSVRGQRTRWGSCTATGNISLNRNLLFVPPNLLDYLLLHELCHTRHLNHSRKYWELVASFEPDYRNLEQQLSHAYSYVPMWAVI
ncbi:MAG: M48 family metallopeptidase [Gammaproteobacteria bacterium]|nr:M48 family metallopeptidase [Gammaproteobacteria bacterium]